MANGTAAAEGRGSERTFFTTMTVAMALIVFAGFARTYYLRPLLPASTLPATLTPLIHVHGVLFSAWMLLLLVQARLVASRNIALHRRVGVSSIPLAILMIGVGTVTALQAAQRGVAPPGVDARQFLVVPLFALVVFGVLYAAAIRYRRQAQTHKRLMLLATIGLLPPALARWIVFYLGLGPPVVLTVTTLFIVPLVVWDLRMMGRLHPATLWSGLLVVLSIPARLAIASTDAWLALADRVLALAQ
jgi:hypothetical protein